MTVLDLYNAFSSLLIGLVTAWFIMSPKIQDGIIIKFGLSMVSVAHLALAVLYLDHPVTHLAFSAARALVHTGGLLIIIGYYVRARRARRTLRRVSDWMSLDGTQMR